MSESFLNGRVTLHCGDMLSVLPTLAENSVDSVVTDAPYHLTSIVKRFGADGAAPAKSGKTGAFARASAGFMGKQWDGGDIAFQPETWAHVLRVLKPGGYIIAFSSSRTYQHMAVAIERAGFITHPLIGRLFDQGGDIAAFLDSLTPAQLEAFCLILDRNDPVAGLLAYIFGSGFPKATRLNACALDGPFARLDVEKYRYGAQALKPALEPIYMGQKPFSEETGTENVLRHGTGALNIEACRVGGDEQLRAGAGRLWSHGRDGEASSVRRYQDRGGTNFAPLPGPRGGAPEGRWPANLIHDGSEEVVSAFPQSDGAQGDVRGTEPSEPLGANTYGRMAGRAAQAARGDAGSAARFFYAAKADGDDRIGSRHPTVKPLDLIQYLVRLVTPPKGVVLDCFAGTGTTGEAAYREGMRAILIEREAEYCADIRRRMGLILAGPDRRKHAIIRERQRGKPDDLSGTLFGPSAHPIAAE